MRTVKYRTTMRVECRVEKGDDIAAIDEARAAVRVAAEGQNHRGESVLIEWEHTDDGITVFAELWDRLDASPPGPTPRAADGGRQAAAHDRPERDESIDETMRRRASPGEPG